MAKTDTANRRPPGIYLDNQATTPTDPRVVEAMLPFFTERFGNPHSTAHAFGWDAEEAVEQARGVVLHVLEEGLQVAFEADLRLHLFKLAAQALALRQAEFVDLLGGQVGGGGPLGLVRSCERRGGNEW